MKTIPQSHLICKRCGWVWIPRKNTVRTCPRCKSYKWNKEKRKTRRVKEREIDNEILAASEEDVAETQALVKKFAPLRKKALGEFYKNEEPS